MSSLPRSVATLRAEMPESQGWLASLPAEARAQFLSIAVARSFPPQQALLHSGDENGGMIGIVSGVVEVRAGTAPADAGFYYLHHSGSWIGYGPVLGRSRTLDAVTRTPVEALLLPHRALRDLLARQPELWRHIAEIAFDDMNSALSGCADLLLNDPLRRLAALLLWLSGCRHHDKGAGETARAETTHKDLASLMNLSRSRIAPFLDYLEQQGFIAKHYAFIEILRSSALRNLADG